MMPMAALDLLSEAAGTPVDETLRARICNGHRIRARLARRLAAGRALAVPPEDAPGRLLCQGSDAAVADVTRVAGALSCAGALRRVVDGGRVRALREAAGERGWAAAIETDAPGRDPCPEDAAGLAALGRASLLDWLRALPPGAAATLALRLPAAERAALCEASGDRGDAFATAAALMEEAADATA